MKKLLLIILPIFSLLLASSCNYESSSKDNFNKVYFGGNIINPNDSVVSLSFYDEQSTEIFAKLDNENSFLYEFDSIQPGIYVFKHGNELQYLYLVNKDSLMLRVNTLEFDESLVFTGKGAAENNYLIKRYLLNEEEKINLTKLYSMNLEDFENSIDSVKKKEYSLLSSYNFEGSDFSSEALKYALDVLKYSEYSIRELYPINHRNIYNTDSLTVVSENFFDYRKDVNLNDNSVIYNQHYSEFLYIRLSTMTLDSLLKVIPPKEYFHHKLDYSLKYSQIRNYFIDSVFTNPFIKKNLLYYSAINLFSKSLSVENLEEQLKPFYSITTDSNKVKYINKLLLTYTNVQKGADCPDFTIFDDISDNCKKHLFSDYFGKPIYLFFWLSPGRYSWSIELTESFNKLKIEYPEIQFISVFLDFPELWNESKKINNVNGIQLMAEYSTVKSKFMLPRSNSFVLIDKNGKIIQSDAEWPSNSKIRTILDNIK